MQVHYRPMVDGDLPDVLALWRRVDGVGLNESDTPECLADYLRRNPQLSRVAHVKRRPIAADAVAVETSSAGEPTGELVAAVLCGHDGRRGYLHHLAVDAAWRRRGIARTMIRQCLADLAAAGITRCNLFLFTDNDEGQSFWQALGWRPRTELCLMQRPTAPQADAEADAPRQC